MGRSKVNGLEDYLSDYKQKQSAALGVPGYAAWIASEGKDTISVLGEAVRRAEAQRIKSLSSYGRSAETLYSDGLSTGGYAAYVNARANRDYFAELDEAYAIGRTTEADNRRAYSDYLDTVAQDAQKAYSSAYKALKSEKITGYDEALSRAKELGLNDADAKKLAEETTKVAVSSLKRDVIKIVVSRRMTRVQTEEYAAALGLPPEVVSELGDYANEINEAINSETEGSYIDYIKNKENNSK